LPAPRLSDAIPELAAIQSYFRDLAPRKATPQHRMGHNYRGTSSKHQSPSAWPMSNNIAPQTIRSDQHYLAQCDFDIDDPITDRNQRRVGR